MILIGMGGNLPSRFGDRAATQDAACAALERLGIRILARSTPLLTEPVPPSDQPWFLNAVLRVETELAPLALLRVLLAVEQSIGRVRGVRNGPRSIDLDLLAYGDRIMDRPQLPHPRLHLRGFVLQPLAEIAPGWVHPVLQDPVETLVERLGGPAPLMAEARHG